MSAPVLRPAIAAKPKALREQIIQQIDMFNQLADPLFHITGRKGRIKWANRAAADLLGAGLENQRLIKVFVSKELRAILKETRNAAPPRGDEAQGAHGDHIVRADNLPGREFRIRLVRLENKTLEGARFLVSLSDVTGVLQLQTQRAAFVANASHELKTPITALSGFIETLEQDPRALETFLPLMKREAHRMRALIYDLLNLAKTEMEAAHPPTDLLTLDPLIEQASSALQQTFKTRRQNLKLRHLSTPCFVRGDARALTTVFGNLLQNASKYAPNETEIQIHLEIRDRHVHIHFHNEGKGIAAKHIPRLTERFYRVDDGRGRQEGGTGLGLAIVKHILIRHHGQLHITSTPGQGACFTVILPHYDRDCVQAP